MRLPRFDAAYWIATLCAALCPVPVSSQTIWTGPDVVFEKAGGADPTLPENQDRITDNVWITRGNSQGIYNAAVEDAYQNSGGGAGPSPVDTEWAFGSTDELELLTFDTWYNTVRDLDEKPPTGPPDSVGQDMVVHLIRDDIYLDIMFLSWGIGSTAGGSFSYRRSTAPVPGDYNGNGLVDAADFSVWLAALGGDSLPNESATLGAVDQADYDFWKSAFAGSSTLHVDAVPEPAAIVLMAVATALVRRRRRRLSITAT